MILLFSIKIVSKLFIYVYTNISIYQEDIPSYFIINFIFNK